MRCLRTAVAAVTLLAVNAAFAQGTDANLARNIAAGCANCHGSNGVSVGNVPSVAGIARSDLVTRMQEFKSGKRSGTVMPQLAKGYTDAQIELAAGWFAAQPAPSK
jgi:cytochrome c553